MQEPSDVLDPWTPSPPGDLSVPQDLQVYPGPSDRPGPTASPLPPGPPTPPGSAVPPSPPRRLRQERTIYNKEQQSQLERQFQMTKYLTYEDCRATAESLGLKTYQVQVWFKNRRAKESRQQRQQQVQPLPRLHRPRALVVASCWVPPRQVPAPSSCHPVFPGTPGFRGLTLPDSSGVFSSVNSAFSRYRPVFAGPCRDAQKSVPAATPAAARPQGSHAWDLMLHTTSFPYYARLLARRNPLEEPLAPARTPPRPVGDGTVDKDTPGPEHYCMCMGSAAASPAGPAGPCTGHRGPAERPASPAGPVEEGTSRTP